MDFDGEYGQCQRRIIIFMDLIWVQAIAVNPEMRYQVVLIKDDSGRESVLVYAVDRADDPLGALVAREPAVLVRLAGRAARLEQPEDVARELGTDAALCAQRGHA